MIAQLVNLDRLLNKKGQKRGERTCKWKKGKSTSPTRQATPIFVECILKSSHKAPKTKMSRTFCHLKFWKTLENTIPHRRFKAKWLISQSIQVHIGLLKLAYKKQAYSCSFFALCTLHSTFSHLMSLKQLQQ
jgi:hypothetical protein